MNPYSVSAKEPLQQGVFGEHSTRRAGSFLYREVDIRYPLDAEFVYSGWWFRQKLQFNGHVVWWQISWMKIQNKAVFRLPKDVDPLEREGRVEIDFGTTLNICRFRIWIGDELVYDEVN